MVQTKATTRFKKGDRAVMVAYGWSRTSAAYRSESACVAELLKLFQTLSN